MSHELVVQKTQMALAVQSMADLERLAERVARTSFAPKDMVGKPDVCFIAMLHGTELGLSPMQSLQSISVINGRPAIWGDGLMALVRSHPECEWVKERIEGSGENMVAICECSRKGVVYEKQFTVAQAKRAQLWGKNVWQQYPERMLQMRARSWLLRDVFADALKGIQCVEEIDDVPQIRVDDNPPSSLADVAARVCEPKPECNTETGEVVETIRDKIGALCKELGYNNDSIRNFCNNLIGRSTCENDEDRQILLEFLEAQASIRSNTEELPFD